MTTLWIAFYDGEKPPLLDATRPPVLVLAADASSLRWGGNSLLLEPGTIVAASWHQGEAAGRLPEGIVFEAGTLTREQRTARSRLEDRLAGAAPGAWHAGLRPYVFGVHGNGAFHLYHLAENTATESSALRYAPPVPAEDGAEGFRSAVAAVAVHLADRRALLRTGRCYAQWRPEIEMERKFTYRAIPDVGALAADLHARLVERRFPGYFPEPHMGFQVFDYENHICDVVGPPAEAGYISFIPQVDGRTTVKRKWFEKNAEIRRESLWPNEAIPFGEFEESARQRVAGDIVALPSFRRKRFDVNFESLETGHVFGVYFDICRTLDADPGLSFGQVEVEYCRSRTLFALADVSAEYEYVCAAATEFLSDHGIGFEQNLYSKLDFARDAHAGADARLMGGAS